MSDTVPKTGGEDPGATGVDPTTATNPQGTPTATDDSDTVTLSTKDYKELQAARDRANDRALQGDQYLEILAKREAVDDWLKENKTDFPDVTRDDLMSAESPDELKELATARQRRYEDVVQDHLKKVQSATAPVLSPEQRAEAEKKLKASPGRDSFGNMLDLRQNA